MATQDIVELLGFVYVAFLVATVVRSNAMKFRAYSAKTHVRLVKQRHKRLAWIWNLTAELLLEVIDFYFGLGLIASVIATLSVIFPALDTQVAAYHDSLLEFATMLITGATVLTGFALTSETLLTAHSERNASTDSRATRIRFVKLFGVLCVLLSLFAVLIRDSNLWNLSWDAMLSAAVLALVIQAIIILLELI